MLYSKSLMKPVIAFVVLLLGTMGIGAYQSYTSDAAVIRRSDPAMRLLTDQAGMSETGSALFLRANPERLTVDELDAACGDIFGGETGFGCFIPAENKIYIRDMPQQFDSIEVVTAAHEMLHAAEYHHGLTNDVASQLTAQFKQLPDDAAFVTTMQVYDDLSADAYQSELYASFPTEVTTLPDSLESHYARYFDRRSDTVGNHLAAEQLFIDKEQELQETANRIDALFAEADTYYNTHSYAAETGDEYNFHRYYELYSSTHDAANKLVDTYNSQVAEFNALSEAFNGEPLETIDS